MPKSTERPRAGLFGKINFSGPLTADEPSIPMPIKIPHEMANRYGSTTRIVSALPTMTQSLTHMDYGRDVPRTTIETYSLSETTPPLTLYDITKTNAEPGNPYNFADISIEASDGRYLSLVEEQGAWQLFGVLDTKGTEIEGRVLHISYMQKGHPIEVRYQTPDGNEGSLKFDTVDSITLNDLNSEREELPKNLTESVDYITHEVKTESGVELQIQSGKSGLLSIQKAAEKVAQRNGIKTGVVEFTTTSGSAYTIHFDLENNRYVLRGPGTENNYVEVAFPSLLTLAVMQPGSGQNGSEKFLGNVNYYHLPHVMIEAAAEKLARSASLQESHDAINELGFDQKIPLLSGFGKLKVNTITNLVVRSAALPETLVSNGQAWWFAEPYQQEKPQAVANWNYTAAAVGALSVGGGHLDENQYGALFEQGIPSAERQAKNAAITGRDGITRNYPVMGRDMLINETVNLGPGQPAVVVDLKRDAVLQVTVDAYRRFMETSKRRMPLANIAETFIEGPGKPFTEVLTDAFNFTLQVMPYRETYVRSVTKQVGVNREALLGRFIRTTGNLHAGGVCLEQAMLTTFLLQNSFDERVAKVSVDSAYVRGVGGHSWVRVVDNRGQIYIIDPTNKLINSLEALQEKASKGNPNTEERSIARQMLSFYLRPEERKSQ